LIVRGPEAEEADLARAGGVVLAVGASFGRTQIVVKIAERLTC